MQSSEARRSVHAALHIHDNTITCARFQTVTNSDRFKHNNNNNNNNNNSKKNNNPTTKLLTTTINQKAPAHTDCETKALHVYKVLDWFWFDINQLVYISDAKKACAEYMFQSISNREV